MSLRPSKSYPACASILTNRRNDNNHFANNSDDGFDNDSGLTLDDSGIGSIDPDMPEFGDPEFIAPSSNSSNSIADGGASGGMGGGLGGDGGGSGDPGAAPADNSLNTDILQGERGGNGSMRTLITTDTPSGSKIVL